MKILIGIDDSPHSKAAVDFVRRMTWPADTQVAVLSVVQPLMIPYSEMYVPAPMPPDFTEEMTRAHRKLVADAEGVLASARLRTSAQVLEGDPRTVLVETAEKEHADLLWVGSHGRTGFAKLVMGSVAQHVMTHAACSVLVVKLENH